MQDTGKTHPSSRTSRFAADSHGRLALLVLILYFAACAACYFALARENPDVSFWDVVLFNLLAVVGNDYEFTGTLSGRLAGLFILGLGMVGLSVTTGYISSVLVARKLGIGKGTKKMLSMENHILVCGWKHDIANLIAGILRKNRGMRASDIVVISSADDVKLQNLLDHPGFGGLNVLRGDFTEEQTLLKANARAAAKVLIVGENQDGLDDELVDSRVFACALLVRNLNPSCHICAEIRTGRYKTYLDSLRCAETIHAEEYTRYILSTSTNYGGMSKVMSALLDNGDDVSIQIAPIPEQWTGRTYGELAAWYKNGRNILLIGVVENMGVEHDLKHRILSDAQKSTDYGAIVQRLRAVKTLETNAPRLNPSDGYVLLPNSGAIILGKEI